MPNLEFNLFFNRFQPLIEDKNWFSDKSLAWNFNFPHSIPPDYNNLTKKRFSVGTCHWIYSFLYDIMVKNIVPHKSNAKKLTKWKRWQRIRP